MLQCGISKPTSKWVYKSKQQVEQEEVLYDSFSWAKVVGGAGADSVSSCAFDVTSSSLCVTGHFSGNATFAQTSFSINTSLSIITEGMIYSNPSRVCDRTTTYNDSYTLSNYNYPPIVLNNSIEIANINTTYNSTQSESCDNGDNDSFTSNSTNTSLRKIKLENENTLIFENTGNTITRYKFARQ